MIEEIKKTNEIIDENKPLLNISLPTPNSGNINAPLTVGQHNAAAKHNFQEIANVLLAIISNQKLLSLTLVSQDKKISELQKSFNELSKFIYGSLNIKKENKKDDKKRK
jgi:hypothetical protein